MIAETSFWHRIRRRIYHHHALLRGWVHHSSITGRHECCIRLAAQRLACTCADHLNFEELLPDVAGGCKGEGGRVEGRHPLVLLVLQTSMDVGRCTSRGIKGQCTHYSNKKPGSWCCLEGRACVQALGGLESWE
jgi:hypothetical protein